MATGVRANSRTVDAQFCQLRDAHVHGKANHLTMDVLEFLFILAAEVADGAVVDSAARFSSLKV